MQDQTCILDGTESGELPSIGVVGGYALVLHIYRFNHQL